MIPPKRNSKIEYVNRDIPDFELPVLAGTTYPARVPDTLDLADRARHAIHGMCASTDPNANAEIYWRANFGWQPPTMYHDYSDVCEFKYNAPSMLLRLACGSDAFMEVEWHRMASLLQMQGPDGLLYQPLTGRPWGLDCGTAGFFNSDRTHFREPKEHWTQLASVGLSGRLLEAAMIYHVLTGESKWAKLGEKFVDGVERLLTYRDDFAYLYKWAFTSDCAQPDPHASPPTWHMENQWLGHSLIVYANLTGSERALDMGYKLARYFALGHADMVGPNGEFGKIQNDDIPEPPGRAHFHSNTLVRMHLLDAGLAKDDREMIELARIGYLYGRNHDQSDALMGYFPENLIDAGYPIGPRTLEACELSEMIYLALRQSTAGVADCWDDVDRWVRNMFAETQLLETDWAYTFSKKHGSPEQRWPDLPEQSLSTYRETEKVPERHHGSWAGWALPNDWQGQPHCSAEACCFGNAANHLYRVWRDMINFDAARNRVTVHLLLNRASPWADINSHIPFTGQVDVTLKRNCELALRVPEWTKPQNCRITINGTGVTPQWEGRYACLHGENGATVTLKCPINERTEKLHLAQRDFTVVVRGNDIVTIEPPGVHHPMFNRQHYRSGETKWKTKDRFVSDSARETLKY